MDPNDSTTSDAEGEAPRDPGFPETLVMPHTPAISRSAGVSVMHGRCLNGLFAVLAVGLSIAQLSVAASPPTSALAVHVETGDLRGTLTAGGARAWYGIPYAAPPVGDRRWRAPGRAPAWSDVRDASHAGSPCAQPSTAADGSVTIAGSEDCLTLNVFHPPGAIDRALPVMVWIHGGGQLYGTGATYDGTQLAISQNVVVVTINYRLGPFGWFHHPAITGTGPKRTTGQFALLDTIAALKWVKRNIAAFGGDAHNVTLFGESAGAQNVYALLFAPSARGLFQRAIAESGGFWNMHLDQAVNARDAHVPGTPLSAHEVVNTLLVQHARAADRAAATRLQTTLSPQALAAWLRRLSAADVLAAYRGAPHLEYDFPSVVYDGVLLPRIDHRRALAQQPHLVPLLIGGNQDEQKAYLWSDPAYVASDSGRLQIRDAARYETVNRLYSDWWNFTAVDDLASRLRSPVYAYRFAWNDAPTAPDDLKALYGSAHGLELAFVFGDFRFQFIHDELPEGETPAPPHPLAGLFHPGNVGSRTRISEAMMAYWGEFARRGQPGRGGRTDLPEWPAFAQAQQKLVFGNGTLSFDATRLTEDELIRRVWSAPGLATEERCAIYLDNVMYPRYPVKELQAHGCR